MNYSAEKKTGKWNYRSWQQLILHQLIKLLNEFLKKDTGKSQIQKLFLTFKGRIETDGTE